MACRHQNTILSYSLIQLHNEVSPGFGVGSGRPGNPLHGEVPPGLAEGSGRPGNSPPGEVPPGLPMGSGRPGNSPHCEVSPGLAVVSGRPGNSPHPSPTSRVQLNVGDYGGLPLGATTYGMPFQSNVRHAQPSVWQHRSPPHQHSDSPGSPQSVSGAAGPGHVEDSGENSPGQRPKGYSVGGGRGRKSTAPPQKQMSYATAMEEMMMRQQQEELLRQKQAEVLMQQEEERMQRQLAEFRKSVGRYASTAGERFESELLAVCKIEFEETDENYLRGCKWSPDGNMLMSNSNDNIIRVFDLTSSVANNQFDVNTELTSTWKVRESDLIYDFCWYPGMVVNDPDTCVFVTASRELPVHMFSALTGELVCTFRPYNNVDEIVAPHSIGFTSDGSYLVCGFNKMLRCFDSNRPGRDCIASSTVVKEKGKPVMGQRGILSCFAAHPHNPSVVAAGAFNGDLAIYDVPKGSLTAVFEGQSGGITHIAFSSDGNYLFAGGRKDPEITCFDIRSPEKVLYTLYRHVATNQRIYFDINRSSRYLLSGHHNGNVTVWDLNGPTFVNELAPWPQLNPLYHFKAHLDTVNGCSINPVHPILATCSGQRHFHIDLMEDDEDETEEPDIEENTLKLWKLDLLSSN